MAIQRYDVVWRDEGYVKVKDSGGSYVLHADHVADRKRLVDALEELYRSTGTIDNGKCAVCRVGYRNWSTEKALHPEGPCDNADCLTHRIDELLEQTREAMRG